MTEITGDLWHYHSKNMRLSTQRRDLGTVVITSNGFVRQNGTCVMGRGVAHQAACRFPDLPKLVGACIKKNGLQVEYIEAYSLVIFPVKYVWWNKADMDLIIQSSYQLRHWLITGFIESPVYMPRPGCGNGGLQWESVRPAIEPILGNRVTIVNQ